MTHSKLALPIAALATVAATAAGVAVAQGPAPTTIEVKPATYTSSPATAPFDAPGVRAIRRGRAIPRGYVLVGREVTITTGAQAAWAAFRVTCPEGKTLRTFARTGDVGPQVVDTRYPGKRSAKLIVDGPFRPATKTGVAYAVCR